MKPVKAMSARQTLAMSLIRNYVTDVKMAAGTFVKCAWMTMGKETFNNHILDKKEDIKL